MATITTAAKVDLGMYLKEPVMTPRAKRRSKLVIKAVKYNNNYL